MPSGFYFPADWDPSVFLGNGPRRKPGEVERRKRAKAKKAAKAARQKNRR